MRGLNIHSKWFCLANHVDTSEKASANTRIAFVHQRRVCIHNQIAIAETKPTAMSVTTCELLRRM